VGQRTDAIRVLSTKLPMNFPLASLIRVRPTLSWGGYGGAMWSMLAPVKKTVCQLPPRLGKVKPAHPLALADEETAMHSPCL
jgi:hypothetical protein